MVYRAPLLARRDTLVEGGTSMRDGVMVRTPARQKVRYGPAARNRDGELIPWLKPGMRVIMADKEAMTAYVEVGDGVPVPVEWEQVEGQTKGD